VEQGLALAMEIGAPHRADLYRLKGELLKDREPQASSQAETCFHTALTEARHHGSRLLELRAAVSLARLWRSQGRREEARELLAGIYGWFTEGFDTMDLVEAKALLDALGDQGEQREGMPGTSMLLGAPHSPSVAVDTNPESLPESPE